MAAFTLSCFALLIFIWSSFGGPIPFKAHSYRFQAAFPEATTLAQEADVRISGVNVGKVKQLEGGQNRTLATIELDEDFAPLPRDTRAILRQKTLLGETYVELTPGSSDGPMLAEDGRLANAQVSPTVELDELLDTFDPATRKAVQRWQDSMLAAYSRRQQDISDTVAYLDGFSTEAAETLRVLNRHRVALGLLVRNAGVTFDALSERDDQLAGLIENSHSVFETTARERDQLAETFRRFPEFLDQSKSTLARLERFSDDTTPLVRDLQPAAGELVPTLASIRRLSPDLERTLTQLGPLVDAADEGLPALANTIDGLRPVLTELVPFLGEVNPVLEYFVPYRYDITDFLAAGGAVLAGTTDPATEGGARRHFARLLTMVTGESLGIAQQRLPSNRGNGYLQPRGLTGEALRRGIFPNWDCANTPGGGEQGRQPGTLGEEAPCFYGDLFRNGDGSATRFPQIKSRK